MAGIGFKLKKLLAEDTYTGLLKGYVFSAVISSGPWLLSVICLSLLAFFSVPLISGADRQAFSAMVVYVYAISLVLTGFLQITITRYIADELYFKHRETIAGTFISVIFLTIVAQGAVSIVLMAFSGMELIYKVSFVIFSIIVSCIWQFMIFLSASSDYKTIIGGFVGGSAISFIAGILGGKYFGLAGYLNGYITGQAFIFFILAFKVCEEYKIFFDRETTAEPHWEFLKYFTKYPELPLMGALTFLAIWIDKFIFWAGNTGERIYDIFYTFPAYDTALFLANLSVVPAMAHFLIAIETNFYTHYKDFYTTISNKSPLSVIISNKKQMTESLLKSFYELFKIQFIIVFCVAYFAPLIGSFLNLSPASVRILRFGIIGINLQSVAMMLGIVLLYFDLRKPVLYINLFFMVSNAVFTLISRNYGPVFYGAGYMFSCLLTFLLSVILVIYYIRKLEFMTFMNQPIAGALEDSEKLRVSKDGSYGRYHIKEGQAVFVPK